eukprot:4947188-Lingulodinium_polyedra.AAC.1
MSLSAAQHFLPPVPRCVLWHDTSAHRARCFLTMGSSRMSRSASLERFAMQEALVQVLKWARGTFETKMAGHKAPWPELQ